MGIIFLTNNWLVTNAFLYQLVLCEGNKALVLLPLLSSLKFRVFVQTENIVLTFIFVYIYAVIYFQFILIYK